jgi:hypothetical protein
MAEDSNTAVADPEVEVADSTAGASDSVNPLVADEDAKDFEFFENLRREAPEDKTLTPAEPDTEAKSKGDKDAPKDAGKTQPKSKAKAETKSEAKAGDAEETSAEPEGFNDALSALLRDQIPKERLEEWFENDPKGFIEHGLKRKSAQADQDRFGQEFSQNRDQFEAWKTSQQESSEAVPAQDQAQAAETPQAQVPVDTTMDAAIDQALAPLVDEDNVELFSDVKDPIKTAIMTLGQGVSTRLTDQFNQQNEIMRKAVEDMGFALVNVQIQAARQKLIDSGQYPKAEDDDWFNNEAMSRYDTLADSSNSQRPASVYDAVEEATKWASANLTVDDLKTSILSRSQGRKNGQPRHETQSRSSEPVTDDQREELEFYKLRRKHGMAAD